MAGALWGVSALAGHPSMILINAGLVALWLPGRLLSAPSDWPPGGLSSEVAGARWLFLRHGTKALAAFGLVGAVILSPTYTAYLIDGKGYSDRSGPLSRETAVSFNALHPSAVMTMASPYAPLPKLFAPWRNYYPGTDGSSIGMYIGAAVAWLALAAVLMRPGSAWRWWLVALAALHMATAMGPAFPLRGWLYDYVPPTRFMRHSSIFRGHVLFLVAVLALLATRDLGGLIRSAASRVGEDRARFILALAGLLVLASRWPPIIERS